MTFNGNTYGHLHNKYTYVVLNIKNINPTYVEEIIIMQQTVKTQGN